MSPTGINSNYSNTNDASGYINEKMYILLQLYLQNKSWNSSLELLQCFSELKEISMLPSASYLQMLVSKITLNNQGRLIFRENGKLIIPYEQFANAVMMKHLDGPHGVHLNLESTTRAVMESFTIGRECFGMEKDFIIEMVQKCPNPACRYYKSQIELSKKSNPIGSAYLPDSEVGAITTQKTNFSHTSEFQMALHIPITSQVGTSAELPDNRNTVVNRQQNHATLIKKVHTKFNDFSTSLTSTELHKLSEFPRTNSDIHETKNSIQTLKNCGKEMLSVQNGMWLVDNEMKNTVSTTISEGQEKVVRAFSEVMKNMSRMKTCVKPAMCKPYGKQSETLQKTLVDTIQLIQSLRSFLPPPHIPVSSWKNEDKHGLDQTNFSYLSVL